VMEECKQRKRNEDLLKTDKRNEKRHRQGQEDEIMEFQRLGRFYCEDYKGHITVDKTQVLKNWENYITDPYDRPEDSNLQTK